MSKTATLITIALVLAVLPLAFAEVAQANPYHRLADFKTVSPPAGTQPPIITIRAPQNGSSHPKNVNLILEVVMPKTNGDKSLDAVSELYYAASWKPNENTVIAKNIGENTSFSIDLSNVPGGNLSVTIHATGVGFYVTGEDFDMETYSTITHYATFEMSSCSTVRFIKDLVPPRFSVQSPQNTTYTASDVTLDFTVNEDVSWMLYCIDGKENQTITGNSIFTGLTNGEHSVTCYVADLAGNSVSSKTIFFSLNSPEPFPIVPFVVASIISSVMLCAGLLVYHKKRRSTSVRDSATEYDKPCQWQILERNISRRAGKRL
jgi:hypothetical protein